MGSYILISSYPFEKRTALIENDLLVELHIETRKDRTILGNIYKGRVVKVLPGISAAFVEIGTERSGFLPLSQTGFTPPIIDDIFDGRISENTNKKIEMIAKGKAQELREGNSIMVQVIKEPMGDKGARLTTWITLPGRYLVYMPSYSQIGISHRIPDPDERARLKDILLNSGIKEDEGFIIRTASAGASEREFRDDIRYLKKLFADIQRRFAKQKTPSLLWEELDLPRRTIRDLLLPHVDKVIVDSKEEYARILNFTGALSPRLKKKIELYNKKEPLFENFAIEDEIKKIVQKRVWLKSGGYLTFDITEALTTIDVNSGRYTGDKNLENTALSINLEAVKEISYQIRLRDIGGIIIIDFIDMEREDNRRKILKSMEEALQKDRARCSIIRFSELGLLEMTRKRVREDIRTRLTEPCIYCKGNGVHLSKESIVYSIFRKILRLNDLERGKEVHITVHPLIADLLFDTERKMLQNIEEKIGKKILVKTSPNLHIEDFDVVFII